MDTWNNFNINPIGANFQQQQQNRWMQQNLAPHYDIIQVNGEAGAQNFRMAPNSTALLLDKTASIVWLAQTDGTGYLTVTPYDITPHQQVPPVNINDLASRVAQLEELVNNANYKSNSYANKQSKKQQQQQQPKLQPTDSAD